jgi:hypothetical protein
VQKLFAIVHSNVYISLAAVSLTVAAQIQLGMPPQWHPYLFIIFFATLFEYNLHLLITILTNKEALNSEKHRWVRENLKFFYFLAAFSVIGFLAVAMLAKTEVMLVFVPIAILTMLYSIPVFGNKARLLRLRQIPFLKIFLISLVWSTSTILLPIVQSAKIFDTIDVITMLTERFLFVFAITIPFDIRDMEVDRTDRLMTIPLLIGEKKSLLISYFLLLLFFLISLFHYQNSEFIILALGISAASTFIFIRSVKLGILLKNSW